MMLYLAGRMSDASELQGWRISLLRTGQHMVSSRWIDEKPRTSEADEEANAPVIAARDMDDLSISQGLILKSHEPRVCKTRHGRLVEFGVALGMGLNCYVVGPWKENVFFSLPQVKFFSDFDALLDVLDTDDDKWKYRR